MDPSLAFDRSKDSSRVRFGRYELLAGERLLLADGSPLKLSARAFDLLCALIQRRDRVVSKTELLDLVWPSLVVEENNLEVHVSALRKVLGSGSITTVSGRGYQFTAACDEIVLRQQPPNNLPGDSTRFIGRSESLVKCVELLHTTRLLTLRGLGGSGKTRLALKLAERLLLDFPHGVWFVDLARIQDGEHVSLAVAEALHLSIPDKTSLNGHIAACLGTQQVLLVLDNCEHVVDAVAATARTLVQGCAAIKLVATSRESLGLPGEQIFPVQPMTVPTVDDDAAANLQAEAVQLFVDRARHVDAALTLVDEDVRIAADICRRLDGIPLAIELAAARLKVVTLRELRQLIEERFRFLVGGSRTPTRHRTLQAVVQWSYEHLSADEQQLYRQLSVFTGGWTLDAACCISKVGIEELLVLDLLSRLVDKSLVTMTPTSDGARYSMLETLRQHAMQLQTESEQEAAEVRTQHLLWCVALVESRSDSSLAGKVQWLRRLDTERENLLAAHRWCSGAGPHGWEFGLRLVIATRPYWIARGLLEMGRRLAVEALALPGVQQESQLRCSALIAVGQLACFMGSFDEATCYCEEGLALARAHDNKSDVAEALLERGHVAEGIGNPSKAIHDYREALDVARESNAKWLEASALASLAELQRVAGNLDLADSLYEESSALRRQLGQVDLAGFLNRAMISIERGDWDRGHALALAAIPFILQTSDKSFGSAMLDVMTGLAATCGAWESVARFHGASDGQHAQMAARREPTDESYVQPMVAKARSAMGASEFEAAKQAARQLGFAAAMLEVEAWLSDHAPRQSS